MPKSHFYLYLARNTEENGHTKYSPKSTSESTAFGSPDLKQVTKKFLKVVAEIQIPYLCIMLPQ